MRAPVVDQGMIPQDQIDSYLSGLFGSSKPGDVLHHLLIAVEKPETRDALGLPKIETTLCTIDPSGPDGGDTFVAKAIMGIIAEQLVTGCVVHFAGLAVEAFSVVTPDEVVENQARVMQGDNRLSEHPAAVETTILLAACREGRRWTGMHYLTGPKAGTKRGPTLHVGALGGEEGGRYARLIRTVVGIEPVP